MCDEDIRRVWLGTERDRRALIERIVPIIELAVRRRLLAIARPHGRDASQDRDDFVNGMLVYLLQNEAAELLRFDPDRGTLETFISHVTNLYVVRQFRTRSRDPYAQIPIDNETIERRLAPNDRSDCRSLARAELDSFYRYLRERLDDRGLLLFQLYIVEERPADEVADIVGTSRDAVYQWRRRLKKIAKQWRDNGSKDE